MLTIRGSNCLEEIINSDSVRKKNSRVHCRPCTDSVDEMKEHLEVEVHLAEMGKQTHQWDFPLKRLLHVILHLVYLSGKLGSQIIEKGY